MMGGNYKHFFSFPQTYQNNFQTCKINWTQTAAIGRPREAVCSPVFLTAVKISGKESFDKIIFFSLLPSELPQIPRVLTNNTSPAASVVQEKAAVYEVNNNCIFILGWTLPLIWLQCSKLWTLSYQLIPARVTQQFHSQTVGPTLKYFLFFKSLSPNQFHTSV